MSFLKRLYQTFIGLADKKYAQWALGVSAFVESFIFPVPPDALLFPMCLGNPAKALRFALICSVFSVLGACAGFFLGKFLWSFAQEWFFTYVFSVATFNSVGAQFKEHAFFSIVTSAFTPIPFKVFTIAAGVFNVSFSALLAGSVVGRSARFFLVAGLIWKFGEDIKPFIDKHFNTLTIVAVIFLAGIIFIVKNPYFIIRLISV